MHLSILVQENPLANTTGHQGYVAPEKAVMQQVKSSLEQKIKQMQISLTGEPVLRLTGLSAATLPPWIMRWQAHRRQGAAQQNIDQQGASYKAGLLAWIYCPSCGHVISTHSRTFHGRWHQDNDCTVPEYLLLCDI